MSGLFYIAAAKKKLGLDDSWKWTSIMEDAKSRGTRVVFSPILGVFKSGPRKGKRKVDRRVSEEVFAIVMDTEMHVERNACIAGGGCGTCAGRAGDCDCLLAAQGATP